MKPTTPGSSSRSKRSDSSEKDKLAPAIQADHLELADRTRCHTLLTNQRSEIVARIKSHEDPVRESQDSLSDEMDQASLEADRGTALRLLDKERNLLREIDTALAKFEQGTYGLCEGTGEPIELRRLLARPWARYSLDFKEALESKERGFSR
jgi:DnaK suppressor protein